MSIAYLEIRQKVITYAHKLQAERLVYSTAGNISVRVPGRPDLLACTPGSTQYDLLEPADIAIVAVSKMPASLATPSSNLATAKHGRNPDQASCWRLAICDFRIVPPARKLLVWRGPMGAPIPLSVLLCGDAPAAQVVRPATGRTGSHRTRPVTRRFVLARRG